METLEHIILAAACLAIFPSCTMEERYQSSQDEDSYFRISLTTKSGTPDHVTYCASFFSYNNEYHYNSGFYCADLNVDGRDWNQPCSVNADGSYKGFDCSKGLRYHNITPTSAAYLVVASPAFAPVEYEKPVDAPEESMQYFGYKQSRVRQTDEAQYLSDYLLVSNAGVYIDGEEVFDISSLPLKEHRSQLTVTIECGEDISSATVRGIEIADVAESAYYNFFRGYENISYSSAEVFHPTSPEVFRKGEPAQTVLNNEYMLSLDYTKLNTLNQPYYTVPKLEIGIGAADDDPVVTLPLTYNFESQYQYNLRIIINSVYVRLKVTAMPWDVNPECSDKIEYPSIVVDYSKPLKGWDNGGSVSDSVETND